jgi:hypothetical protein
MSGSLVPADQEIRPCDGFPDLRESTSMPTSFQHPSYQSQPNRITNTLADHPVTPEPAAIYTPARRHSRRACCCPARPAVIAVLPPAGGRRAATELLLCGHHYRQSKQALAAKNATILDAVGYPLGSQTWPEPGR